MSFDTRTLRDAMGCFTTGITVVTTRGKQGEPLGLTANSFNTVSLDPPLVLFSLSRKSATLAAFLESQCFGVNVLREDQEDLSARFAGSGPNRWDGIAVESWETGAPIFPGSLASFDCSLFAHHEGGDHVIFVGQVRKLAFRADDNPLVYFRGKYRRLHGV